MLWPYYTVFAPDFCSVNISWLLFDKSFCFAWLKHCIALHWFDLIWFGVCHEINTQNSCLNFFSVSIFNWVEWQLRVTKSWLLNRLAIQLLYFRRSFLGWCFSCIKELTEHNHLQLNNSIVNMTTSWVSLSLSLLVFVFWLSIVFK